MKKEIVIVTHRQGAIAVPATIIVHPNPAIGEVGIHKTVGGRDWTISHVRTGRRFLSRSTRKAAIAWAEDFSLTDEQTEILKRTESAPPVEDAKPLPKPEPKTIDIDPMLALIEEEGDLCHADYYRCQYPQEWLKARRLNRLNTWRDDTGIEYVEVVAKGAS